MLNRTDASTDAAKAEKADDDFVTTAEEVISIQNGAWMSRNISAAGAEDPGDRPAANAARPGGRRDPLHRCLHRRPVTPKRSASTVENQLCR